MLTSTAGAIQRVRSDGTVYEPIVQSDALRHPTGMAQALAGFGAYGGQWLVADLGDSNIQMTQATDADGRVYRVDASGDVQLVASGFHNPVGLHFVGDALWVTDTRPALYGISCCNYEAAAAAIPGAIGLSSGGSSKPARCSCGRSRSGRTEGRHDDVEEVGRASHQEP